MASEYEGNPDATQAPSPAPGLGVLPIISLPEDGIDDDGAAPFYQALKTLADFIAKAQEKIEQLFRATRTLKALVVDGTGDQPVSANPGDIVASGDVIADGVNANAITAPVVVAGQIGDGTAVINIAASTPAVDALIGEFAAKPPLTTKNIVRCCGTILVAWDGGTTTLSTPKGFNINTYSANAADSSSTNGDIRVNFKNPLPNTDYIVVASYVNDLAGAGGIGVDIGGRNRAVGSFHLEGRSSDGLANLNVVNGARIDFWVIG